MSHFILSLLVITVLAHLMGWLSPEDSSRFLVDVVLAHLSILGTLIAIEWVQVLVEAPCSCLQLCRLFLRGWCRLWSLVFINTIMLILMLGLRIDGFGFCKNALLASLLTGIELGVVLACALFWRCWRQAWITTWLTAVTVAVGHGMTANLGGTCFFIPDFSLLQLRSQAANHLTIGLSEIISCVMYGVICMVLFLAGATYAIYVRRWLSNW